VQTYDQRLKMALDQVDRGVHSGPFRASWESLSGYQIPNWYRDAKFGIFVHWGVYAVPAFDNEWYPRNMYLESSRVFQHHVSTYGPQIKFGYKDFIPRFTAAKFDAEQWARLFRKAGARYVIPVAEHHDGFSMYNNPLSEWNAVNRGPKKDVLSLVAGAVRRNGMIFGASSHRAEHWWFFEGGMQFPSDVKDPANAGLYGPAYPRKTGYGDESQPDKSFLDDWLGRTAALIEQYRPQILWFDWWIEQPAFEPYRRTIAAYLYNRTAQWGREAVLNYKLGAFPEKAAVLDVERGQLGSIRPLAWQTDTSISTRSWGYISDDQYKSAGAIIDDLVDIVSKNGNLLLNVGPRADGTIPAAAEKLLLEIGAWLDVNGEAIYGTRPWRIYGEGPTEVVAGGFKESERPPFTGQDIRFTAKDGVLYAIALEWPEGGRLVIRSLGEGSPHGNLAIRGVSLLGSGVPLKWSRTPQGLAVDLPASRPGNYAYCVKIVTR
jgi:alpha-L-fucosidase